MPRKTVAKAIEKIVKQHTKTVGAEIYDATDTLYKQFGKPLSDKALKMVDDYIFGATEQIEKGTLGKALRSIKQINKAPLPKGKKLTTSKL